MASRWLSRVGCMACLAGWAWAITLPACGKVCGYAHQAAMFKLLLTLLLPYVWWLHRDVLGIAHWGRAQDCPCGSAKPTRTVGRPDCVDCWRARRRRRWLAAEAMAEGRAQGVGVKRATT